MNVEPLLSRLDGVKETQSGCWVARCPAHEDRRPSLSIRETDDGRLLVHCFAGCETPDVLAAIGLSLPDLFPERIGEHFAPERRPFPATDVLRCIAKEALVVATSGAKLLAGEPFGQQERDRLMLAVARIQSALDAAGVQNG
ncbi:MAG: DNA primase [Betaproteobacteria bacterium]|nr:DNA primase [Betaproteobacteria bacterium]